MSEVQKPVLEYTANENPYQDFYEEIAAEDSPIVTLVTNGTGGHAVFDRDKLKRFFETHSDNYLPIYENGAVVGTIPMGSWRAAWRAGELDTEPNLVPDCSSHQNPSSLSV